MIALRRLFLAHRHLALLICVAALALKLLVPAGYMIAIDHGQPVITVCPGMAPQAAHMDMSALHGDMMAPAAEHGSSKEHGKADQPCAFASLSAQALAAVDSILLGAALVFVVAIGLRAAGPRIAGLAPYLRPPSRAPPGIPSTC